MAPASTRPNVERAKAPSLRIAEAARLVGVSQSTIRLWEFHGLIRPSRNQGVQRRFGPRDIERLREIKQLRDLKGLNLAAIRETFSPSPETENGNVLGGRLRAARKRLGITLKEASERTGMAPSYISAIESSSESSSMAALSQLAEAYGIQRIFLGETGREEAEVVRANQGNKVSVLGPLIEVEQLNVGSGLLDCEKWTLQPGANSNGSYRHNGEEFLLVLEGTFEIVIDERDGKTLHVQDSIYFSSHRTHAWRNAGNDICVVLWINAPEISSR